LFSSEKRKEINVPKYVIERDIPGVGNLSAEQLQAISQKSCDVLRELGPQIQWLHSYVTGDKIYCIYIAQNEAMVRAHAQRGGFPANRISEIKQVIDPTTARDDLTRRCGQMTTVASSTSVRPVQTMSP